jgi:hypothetical protein
VPTLDAISLLTSEFWDMAKTCPTLCIILRLESKDAVRVNGRLFIVEAANSSKFMGVNLLRRMCITSTSSCKLGNIITIREFCL